MEAKKLEFKNMGNKHFVAKEYGYALCRYTSALHIDPNDQDVLSNRALCYNSIGAFISALEDEEKVLATNPSHRKCNYRKVKSLWGLGRYEDALKFLSTTVPPDILESDEFKTLIPTTEKLLKQSKGEFDMVEITNLPKGKYPDMAEYTAPLEIVPDLPGGKGRGIIAKTDFNTGDLLICCRAFSVLYSDSPSSSGSKAEFDTLVKQLSVNIMSKSMIASYTREEFFKLYGGPKSKKSLEWLCSIDEKKLTPQIVNTRSIESSTELEDVVDITNEIQQRIFFNMFCITHDELMKKPFAGIWILPSYLNHSCVDANAYWKVFGDMLMVRAVKPIKKGEEISIAYIRTPSDPLSERAFGFHQFGEKIICPCRVCVFERSWFEEQMDSNAALSSVQLETQKVLELTDVIKSRVKKSDKRTLKLQVADIKKIISLRKENSTLNIDLLNSEIREVCGQLLNARMFQDAVEIYEAIWIVTSNSGFVVMSEEVSTAILMCHLQLGNDDLVDKWRKQCKLDRLANYGTDKYNSFVHAGSQVFKLGQIGDAVRSYQKALMLDPDNEDILSKRALAYLTMGSYQLALSDTEQVLKNNPTHSKCIFLKVKSLLGLARFDKALEFLKTKVPKELLEKEKDFSDLIPLTEKLKKQSKGDYDMIEIMKLPEDKCNEVAEYTGPIEIVPIPGKGRGVRATKDISAGQLITCSKAFAYLAKKLPRALTPLSTDNFVMQMLSELLSEITKKFFLDPTAREVYYNLDNGPENKKPAGWLKKQCETFFTKTSQAYDDKMSEEMVDKIKQRAFYCSTGPIKPHMEGRLIYALWPITSYFNHSCLDCNANLRPYGDIAMIRAVRDIKAGEEITISYCSSSQESELPIVFKKFQFTCDCKWCKLQRNESRETKMTIKNILKEIRDNLIYGADEEKLREQSERVKKLVELRADNPRANMALMDNAVVSLSLQLRNKRMWKESAYLFEHSYNLCVNTSMVGNAVNLSECAMHCYMELGNRKDEVQKWKKRFHEARIVAYGVDVPDYQEK